MQKDFILVIGLGYMGGSLARGLINSAESQGWMVGLHDIHQEKIDQFKSKYSLAISDLRNKKQLPRNPDAVIICVKPHDFQSTCDSLGNILADDAMLISVLAGVEINEIRKLTNFDGAIVRVMPNIAAGIQLSASALCGSQFCTTQQTELAQRIFDSVGESVWVKESLMDSVTGLSGSGPAYIYMVIEALIDGGVKMGLPRDLATKLTIQTVLGAASLVKNSNQHPAILKDQVTTPAGTTISALHVLEERGLRSMFVAAVEEATMRSRSFTKIDNKK